MRRYQNEDFSGLDTYEGPHIIADLAFRRCAFYQCFGAPPRSPDERLLIQRVELIDCKEMGCDLYGAILEDIYVRNLKRLGSRPLFLWACAYRHVTLEGPIPGLKVNETLRPQLEPDPEWEPANAIYHRGVDWALDISKAQFGSTLDFPGIPAHLIKRDPTDQVILSSARAREADWVDADLGIFRGYLERLRASSGPSIVVCAGKRDKAHYQENLRHISTLRQISAAEPD